jgi:hypothetical protein
MGPVTVTLPPEAWNVILAALGEVPHRVAAPIIAAILRAAEVQGVQDGDRLDSLTPLAPAANGHAAS